MVTYNIVYTFIWPLWQSVHSQFLFWHKIFIYVPFIKSEISYLHVIYLFLFVRRTPSLSDCPSHYHIHPNFIYLEIQLHWINPVLWKARRWVYFALYFSKNATQIYLNKYVLYIKYQDDGIEVSKYHSTLRNKLFMWNKLGKPFSILLYDASKYMIPLKLTKDAVHRFLWPGRQTFHLAST